MGIFTRALCDSMTSAKAPGRYYPEMFESIGRRVTEEAERFDHEQRVYTYGHPNYPFVFLHSPIVPPGSVTPSKPKQHPVRFRHKKRLLISLISDSKRERTGHCSLR